MSPFAQDLSLLLSEIRTWLIEEYPLAYEKRLPPTCIPQIVLASKAHVEKSLAEKRVPPPRQEEVLRVEEVPQEFAQLRKWAEHQMPLQEPVTTVVCLGTHPLLVKLAAAIAEKIAPASCCTTLPSLAHPLLKALLVPLPVIHSTPDLARRFPQAKPHQFTPPLLPLHPLEVYLNDPHAKRLLWDTIQKLPLFS